MRVKKMLKALRRKGGDGCIIDDITVRDGGRTDIGCHESLNRTAKPHRREP